MDFQLKFFSVKDVLAVRLKYLLQYRAIYCILSTTLYWLNSQRDFKKGEMKEQMKIKCYSDGNYVRRGWKTACFIIYKSHAVKLFTASAATLFLRSLNGFTVVSLMILSVLLYDASPPTTF